MADVVFVPRSRWRRAYWRIAARTSVRRPPRTRLRRLWRLARRTWGFAAFAGLTVVALLLNAGAFQSGTGPPAVGRVSAVAVDGDSLRTGVADIIRLSGIDAPELSQTCRDEHGRVWACGSEAHLLLRTLASQGALDCTSSERDQYGRTLATCATQEVPDIGEAMVRAGLAVSFMSPRYRIAELDARWNKRGLWRGTFDHPQAWRRGARRAD